MADQSPARPIPGPDYPPTILRPRRPPKSLRVPGVGDEDDEAVVPAKLALEEISPDPAAPPCAAAAEAPAPADAASVASLAAFTARVLPEKALVNWRKRILKFWFRASGRWTKGFLMGFTARSLLTVLPVLIKTGSLRKSYQVFRDKAGFSVSYGAFLGSLLAIFESVMNAGKTLEVGHNARGLLAGALAGSSLMFLPRSSRMTVCLFFLVRALEIGARYLVQAGMPSLGNGGSVAVMALASAQVIWAYLYCPQTLDPGYAQFLFLHGGKPAEIRRAFLELHRGDRQIKESTRQALDAYRSTLNAPPLRVGGTWAQQMCDVVHGHMSGTSCVGHVPRFQLQALRRAVPVYAVVHLLPLLLFKRGQLLRTPGSTLWTCLMGIARSSWFLATYCMSAWAAACTQVQILGTKGDMNGAIAGLVGGCTVAIEQPGRRVELALYVLSHALQSFWRALPFWGLGAWRPNVPHADLLLFCGSLALLGHAYINRPQLMRRSYVGLIHFLFGSGRRKAGFEVDSCGGADSAHPGSGVTAVSRGGSPRNLRLAPQQANALREHLRRNMHNQSFASLISSQAAVSSSPSMPSLLA